MIERCSPRTSRPIAALLVATLLSLALAEPFAGHSWVDESSDVASGWYGELPFSDYPSDLVLERSADTVTGLLHYRGTVYPLEAEVAGPNAWGRLTTPHGVMGAALWFTGEPPRLMLAIVDIDAAGEPQHQLSQTFVFSDAPVSTGRPAPDEPEPYLAAAEQLHSDDAGVRAQAADALFDALPASLPVTLTKIVADDWRAREGAARVSSRLPELTWLNRILMHDDDAAVRRVVLTAFDELGVSELLDPYLADLIARLTDDEPESRALAFRIFVWNTASQELPERGESYSQSLLDRLEPALPGLIGSFDAVGSWDQRVFLDMTLFLGPLTVEVTPLLKRLRQDATHPHHDYAVALLAHLDE